MTDVQFWQLVVSGVAPFVAAAGALGIVALQRRERFSCSVAFVWGGYDGHEEHAALVIHNTSDRPILIQSIFYIEGVLRRRHILQTPIDYEDPRDINLPCLVQAGAMQRYLLDERLALRSAEAVTGLRWWLARVLRRPRFLIECRTAGGRRRRISGEGVLSWEHRAPWARLSKDAA